MHGKRLINQNMFKKDLIYIFVSICNALITLSPMKTPYICTRFSTNVQQNGL